MPRLEWLILNRLRLSAAGQTLLWRLVVERAHALRTEYLRGLWRQFHAWRRRKLAIAQLGALDDAALKDIGIHRSGIEAAVEVPNVVKLPPRRTFAQKPQLYLQRTG